MRGLALACVIAVTGATAAQAELRKLNTFEEFVTHVQGKTLSRPFVKLTVSTDGTIEGRGLRWDVEGNWRWQNGYFCRDLFWGGDALGYNCQEVRAYGDRIKFTSDKGAGDSAMFKLN